VKTVDLVKENDFPILVMELCSGGLQKFIDDNKGKPIPEDFILKVLSDAC
jgi:hypothetical protein